MRHASHFAKISIRKSITSNKRRNFVEPLFALATYRRRNSYIKTAQAFTVPRRF